MLRGGIEVDETFLGAEEEGKPGRGNNTLYYKRRAKLMIAENFSNINSCDFLQFATLVLPISFLVIYLVIWKKNSEVKTTLKNDIYYPPLGLNSAEIGFMQKGRANNEDIVSLLIYLAGKGYIKISELKNESFSPYRTYRISKIKVYDGSNITEKMFLDTLFDKQYSCEDNCMTKDTVLCKLSENFYDNMKLIKKSLNANKNKKMVFANSAEKIIFGVLAIAIIYILTVIKPLSRAAVEGVDFLEVSLLITIFHLLIGIGFFSLIRILKGINNGLRTDYFLYIFVIFLSVYIAISKYYTIKQYLFISIPNSIIYFYGMICVYGMAILINSIKLQRTTYGNKILREIRGFSYFLKTAKDNQLEDLIAHNPNYPYDMLPYAYALNVSDTWVKKFNFISLKEPDWHCNVDSNEAVLFPLFFKRLMKHTLYAMTAMPLYWD